MCPPLGHLLACPPLGHLLACLHQRVHLWVTALVHVATASVTLVHQRPESLKRTLWLVLTHILELEDAVSFTVHMSGSLVQLEACHWNNRSRGYVGFHLMSVWECVCVCVCVCVCACVCVYTCANVCVHMCVKPHCSLTHLPVCSGSNWLWPVLPQWPPRPCTAPPWSTVPGEAPRPQSSPCPPDSLPAGPAHLQGDANLSKATLWLSRSPAHENRCSDFIRTRNEQRANTQS